VQDADAAAAAAAAPTAAPALLSMRVAGAD